MSSIVTGTGNSKFELIRYIALNFARALARNNTSSKSTIMSKSKKKANREDNNFIKTQAHKAHEQNKLFWCAVSCMVRRYEA